MFSLFRFYFSVTTAFAVWRVEINYASHLSSHACNRIWDLHKCTSIFCWLIFLLYFLHFQTSWSTCYSWGKYQVMDHSPGPILSWYHTLRFLPVGMFERICFQKFCGWHFNPSWKGVVKDILTHTWAQLVCQLYVIRATRGSLDEVDWSTHTLFELQNSLQKSSYFYLFWLSCNKSLKNTRWIVFHSCADNISEAFVQSMSCKHHQNTAECKFSTWNS